MQAREQVVIERVCPVRAAPAKADDTNRKGQRPSDPCCDDPKARPVQKLHLISLARILFFGEDFDFVPNRISPYEV
jgi:hypothetical protein